jgi:hypothetical protein
VNFRSTIYRTQYLNNLSHTVSHESRALGPPSLLRRLNTRSNTCVVRPLEVLTHPFTTAHCSEVIHDFGFGLNVACSRSPSACVMLSHMALALECPLLILGSNLVIWCGRYQDRRIENPAFFSALLQNPSPSDQNPRFIAQNSPW